MAHTALDTLLFCTLPDNNTYRALLTKCPTCLEACMRQWRLQLVCTGALTISQLREASCQEQ